MTQEEMVQEVLDRVLQSSTGVEGLEIVTSLSGVKSLPGEKDGKMVRVPLSLLSALADAAASRANKAAEVAAGLEQPMKQATDAANAAADAANDLVPKMDAADKNAQEALTTANDAKKKVDELVKESYTHKEMTEEEFETLPTKDERTIYMLYEE